MNSIVSRDSQIKMMESTVTNTEKHMGQLCTTLAAYTRKTARLRDKADLLVRQLSDFANTEEQELRACLKNLAEDLAMVQDYRQAEVERLEMRVVAPLKAYGDIVKNKRADIKKFSGERTRELKEVQKLDRIRLKNPSDRLSIAESNALKASTNVNRSTRQLEETIIEFQRQKLEDVKRTFTDFLTVEMLFHAKALEVYSKTFQNLENLDIEKDLEIFSTRFQMIDSQMVMDGQTLQSMRFTSSMPRYPSPTPSTLRQTADYPRKGRSSALRRQQGVDQEEEEVDDEEEYESEEEEEEHELRRTRESYASEYVRARRHQK